MSVLAVNNINKTFAAGGMFRSIGKDKKAVNDVSFQLAAGETLAIVGESGSGKSTTARLAMRLLTADSGSVFWGDDDACQLSGKALRQRRSHIQMVFQDPFASLNPRMKIWQTVAEGLRVHQPALSNAQRREKVVQTLNLCGLDAISILDRYPHQFSGGQRQRIGIARALIVEPQVLVLDEPVSALDVSVQAQILNLLKELQKTKGLAYLFISHDLSVVHHIADRVAVMFGGRIVEQGNAADVFAQPQHPYTQALLDARPITHPDERNLDKQSRDTGEGEADSGCAYQPRCPYADKACADFDSHINAQGVACLHPLNCSDSQS